MKEVSVVVVICRAMASANHSLFVQKELFGDLIVSHLNMDCKTISDVISSGFCILSV